MLNTVLELEKKLAEPSEQLLNDIAAIDGDIMLIGIYIL